MALRTSLPVQPHLYIGDSTGRPLDYGRVYFGQPHKDPEFYPIDIYYDEALTIAASQPVRTKGGFLNANGDMTEIYAGEQVYSVKVLDAQGLLIFYKPMMQKSGTDESVSTKLPYPSAILRPQSDKNAEQISVKDFGAVGDGVLHPLSEKYSTLALAKAQYPAAMSLSDSIDSLAIQAAIDAVAASGMSSVIRFDGHFVQDRTIVLKSKVHLQGSGLNTATIYKADGFNGRALITEGFDALTGTIDNNMPYGFSATGIMFDGRFMANDWMSATNSYVNTSGGGVFIYGRDYELDIDVRYQAGIGVWLEGKVDGTSFNKRYDLKLDLRVFVCKEECLIFKGGADIVMNQVFCAFGGAVHKQDEATLPRISPTYGATNGGRTDNMVFDEGCEISTIHTWAAQSGYGMKFKKGRFNADLLISESVRMGAFDFDADVYGMIDRMDAHSCYGNMDGSTPDIVIKSNKGAGLHIGKIRNQRNGYANMHGQTALQIDGAFTNIGHFGHDGMGKGGHAVKITGTYNSIADGLIHNVIGNAADGTPSAGYWRKSTGSNSVKLKIIGAPVVFWSDGSPKSECVTIDFINTAATLATSVVKGDIRNYGWAQVWRINGYNNDKYLSTESTVSAPFNSSSAVEQNITVNHSLVSYSNIVGFQVTVAGVGAIATEYCYVSAVTDTTVTVKLKMLVPTPSDLKPQINVLAKA